MIVAHNDTLKQLNDNLIDSAKKKKKIIIVYVRAKGGSEICRGKERGTLVEAKDSNALMNYTKSNRDPGVQILKKITLTRLKLD